MKYLFTGFSPNTTMADVGVALRMLWPWNWTTWVNGSALHKVEGKISRIYEDSHVHLVDSGRSAIYLSLKALEVGKGDVVAVQAFTCVVVINAIKATGATPRYIDIDVNLNMCVDSLTSKMDRSVKCIIIQHTFGVPAQIKQIIGIARRNGARTLEDCAHTFAEKSGGKLMGLHADVGILSFGSDKAISSVRGGAILTKDNELSKNISKSISKLPPLRKMEIARHLHQPIVFFLGKMFYGLFLGKILLHLASRLRLTNRVIEPEEKSGGFASYAPAQYPNALATLLLGQLAIISNVNTHRRNIAAIYERNLPDSVKVNTSCDVAQVRFPIIVDEPKKLQQLAKNRGVIMGNWYDTVVSPADISFAAASYKFGSCPNAENASAHIVNLPTNVHISKEDAIRISNIVK